MPLLRNRGIRTLGEAIRATASLRQLIDEQLRAGWTDVSAAPADQLADLGPRIDTYPYRHRVRDIMNAPPRFVSPHTTMGTAIGQITREKISSLYVHAGDGVPRPADTGIVTERDLLRQLAERGPDALSHPVDSAMSKPLAVVDADAFAYVAIGRMNRLGVRHLGVVDSTGTVVGALSARDLLRLRAQVLCCSATTSARPKPRPSSPAPGLVFSRWPRACSLKASPAATSPPSSRGSSAR